MYIRSFKRVYSVEFALNGENLILDSKGEIRLISLYRYRSSLRPIGIKISNDVELTCMSNLEDVNDDSSVIFGWENIVSLVITTKIFLKY